MNSAVEPRVTAFEGLTAEASRALSERMGDSQAVAAIRAAGARAGETLPMPTRSDRPWKYYDPEQLDLGGYRPAIDGEFSIVVPSLDGLTAVAFSGAPDEAKAIIDRHLGSAVAAGRSKLAGIHYGFLRHGALVEAKANVESREPVRIIREYVAGRQLGTPHTLVVAGANSRLNVIEEFSSSGEDMVILPVIELVPGPGAEIRYTAIHRWGANSRVFVEQRAITERDSAVISLSLVTGGKVVKSHIESSLVGRGSSSELFGLNIGTGSEHCDVFTIQDHIGPDTRSDLLYKSALKGDARAVYYGLTRVGLSAKNADANQENRNLLLSDSAKADSDPVLEILTNDVIRVSHGATAGPVDEEQLYYLETRGISKPEAEALLVRGFLGQVLDRVPDEALRDELAAVLDEKLEERA